MRRFKLTHETTYRFGASVQLGAHKLLVRPREGHDIRIERATLKISPSAVVKWHRDAFDNSVAVATFVKPCRELRIVSEALLQQFDEWPLDFLVDDHAVAYPFLYNNDEFAALVPFIQTSEESEDKHFLLWLDRFVTKEGVQTYSLLREISSAIFAEHQYRMREEPGVQSPGETLRLGSGSCRDFAWLMMVTARELGLAARFVSGYLHAPATEFDIGATHAWAEIYLPGAGWKGFDPTIGELAGSHHIPAAVAIQPSGVPPVSGSFIGPSGTLSVMEVRVQVKSLD